jgi:type I restriction enzyme S subunit
MSKNNIIPSLRFPEFKSDGNWEERFVDEFFSVGSSKRVLQEDWTDSGVPFYRTRELVSLSKNEPFGSEIFISEELYLELSEKYGIPTEGDFLVSGVGTLGICYQVRAGDRFYFKDGNVLWFKRESGINSTYFKFCFQSDHIQKQIVTQTSLSTVGTYTIQNAKKTKLWYPPKPQEQQKIAACLSSLDEVITAERQKLEVLKEHKKGLLQNLFPQDGETVPKFRFKEFEGSGEWVEKEFGNFCNSLSSGKDKNIDDGEYELYGSTGIIGRAESASYEGDYILVARVGANAGFLKKVKGRFGVTDNTLVIDLIKKDIINFIYYSLQNVGLKELVFGSGQPLITGGQLKSLQVLIPPTEKEQEKIADTLSSIDDLINAQYQKIEALQLHKKGLLQGLFPNVNES